jgi:hypothetical protein
MVEHEWSAPSVIDSGRRRDQQFHTLVTGGAGAVDSRPHVYYAITNLAGRGLVARSNDHAAVAAGNPET